MQVVIVDKKHTELCHYWKTEDDKNIQKARKEEGKLKNVNPTLSIK